jgi:hypothetical protein
MKKEARRADARIMHSGCNSLDSIRILTIGDVLRHGQLTDKEYAATLRRYKRIQNDTMQLRKIAQVVERRSK